MKAKTKIKTHTNDAWFFKFIVFSAIALGLLLFITQFSYKSLITPTPTDATANWKTYTNTVYGVSLKYPSSDEIKKCGGESTNKLGQISGPADGTEKECVYTATSFVDLNFLKEPFESVVANDKTNNNSKGASTTISGKPAYVVVHEVSSKNSEKNKNVYIKQSPTETIWLNGRYDDSTSIALFDQILSTFKFTDQTTSEYEVIDKSTSPNGLYTAIKTRLADYIKISIQDKSAKVLVEDVISINNDSIWTNMEKLGLKGKGMIGYSVKEWKNNSTFILQMSPASGDEFEVEVNASTGKIDETTFKRIK